MIIKNYTALLLLKNPGKDAPALETLRICHFDDLSLYIHSEEDKILMILAANAFDKSKPKLDSSTQLLISRHARVLLEKLQFCHLEKDQDMFFTFALIVVNKIQQTKSISNSNMLPFITTMSSFNYFTKNKTKKWEAMAEKR